MNFSQFREYKFLLEIFDNPYKTIEDTSLSKEDKDKIQQHHGISDYSEHKILDDAHAETKTPAMVTMFKRNGAYEIHHTIDDNVDAGMLDSATKPNPRFISTMLGFAKKHLNSGHSVRIVAPKNSTLLRHYVRIGSALSKKHGYGMSDLRSHSKSNPHNKEASKYEEFHIYPK